MSQESYKYQIIDIFNKSNISVSRLAEGVQLSLSMLEELLLTSTDTCLTALMLVFSSHIR